MQKKFVDLKIMKMKWCFLLPLLLVGEISLEVPVKQKKVILFFKTSRFDQKKKPPQQFLKNHQVQTLLKETVSHSPSTPEVKLKKKKRKSQKEKMKE